MGKGLPNALEAKSDKRGMKSDEETFENGKSGTHGEEWEDLAGLWSSPSKFWVKIHGLW